MTDLEDLATGLTALLNMLQTQQQTNAGLLGSIADLYTKVGGQALSSEWIWTDEIEATSGQFNIQVLSGNDREIGISTTDADGTEQNLGSIVPGSSLVMMDSPGGPVTAFRQYTVVASPALLGADLWSFAAVRVATFGAQDIPSDGTRIRLLFG